MNMCKSASPTNYPTNGHTQNIMLNISASAQPIKTHTHTRMHTRTHTHSHMHMHTHTHMRTHTRMHTCTHTLMHKKTFHGDSLMVFAQSPSANACISICAHIKNPKHLTAIPSYHCMDTQTYCTHWQAWVALLLQLLLPYPGN